MAEWTIFVMPELYPELRDQCVRLGGYVRWSNPIMLLQGRPHVMSESVDAEIDFVRGYFLRNLARNVMGEAFHMDNSINRNMVRAEHDDDPMVHHYLAYFQDHPGAAATMTYTDGIAGIWNVGTRRMFRRRGLAQALMARMLSDAAAASYDCSTLLASNQGLPLYHKLGYQTVAQAFYMGVSPY
jgi:ribosomal protein S18 acetylase RimI-like enzyme